MPRKTKYLSSAATIPNAAATLSPGYLASLRFGQTSVSRDHTVRSRASAIPRASGHSLVLKLELLGGSSRDISLGGRCVTPPDLICGGGWGSRRLWGTWRLGVPVAAVARVLA